MINEKYISRLLADKKLTQYWKQRVIDSIASIEIVFEVILTNEDITRKRIPINQIMVACFEEMNMESSRTIRPESINTVQNVNVQQANQIQQVQQVKPQNIPEQRTEVVQNTQEAPKAQNPQNMQPQQEKVEETVTLPGFEDLDTNVQPIEKEEVVVANNVAAMTQE